MAKAYSALALSLLLVGGATANAQSGTNQATGDRASAYYNFAMGHLYADLAGNFGNRGDYVTKAIEHYKAAIKADPSASFLTEELSDLYIQSGKLNDAIAESEASLKQNPNDLNARRILARIYTRLIGGDSAQAKLSEEMLKKSIEQYQKIVELDPKDSDAWLMLGRLQKVGQNSVESEKAYKKVLELEPNNEDAMTGLAMVYADLGDNKAATEMLRKVADKNPNMRTLIALAGTYEQMREYALAAETYNRALAMSPDKTDIKRALAQSLLLSDQLDESLKTYQELAQEDPKDAQAQLRISQIYRQKREFGKAREAAQKAKELDPNNLEVRYNEVNLLEAEGNTSGAIALMKDLLAGTAKKSYGMAEKGNRVALIERLGTLYRNDEQFDQAVETFRQIAELDPDLGARSSAQVVETWRAAKDFNKALQESDAAAKKYPSDRMTKLVRASVLADLNRTDEAAKTIRALLDGKSDRETYLSLAQVYDKGKNYAEMAKAIDAADKLSDSKDDKETIYFTRGAMYEKLKKYDEAEAQFRKVLEMNPANASALNYLGYMFADRNVRLQEAHQLISKALEQDPGNGAYLDSLGWALFRMNRLDEAEKLLRQAVEKTRRDPTVHDHLGDVLFREGKFKEAIAQWQSSLKEWESSAPAELDHTEIAKVQKKLEGAKVRLARETSSVPKHQ